DLDALERAAALELESTSTADHMEPPVPHGVPGAPRARGGWGTGGRFGPCRFWRRTAQRASRVVPAIGPLATGTGGVDPIDGPAEGRLRANEARRTLGCE